MSYLRFSWVDGYTWFQDTLLDADVAINAMMWQNAGRSGIDQWNFILSPETASQDPSGKYVRKWVPELARLPNNNHVHRPWTAPQSVLTKAGISLGETYPLRVIVDLKSERRKGLESVLRMRKASPKNNSPTGYDLITLPDGSRSIVFTKKEYRIQHDCGQIRSNVGRKQPKTARKRRR